MLLEQCDESLDLIVLPESADVPAYAPTREMSEASVRKYNEPLLAAAAETAVRCRAIVCVNARSRAESGLYRNTTWVFDREGRVAGQYHKQHLVPDESDPAKLCLESGYTWEWSEPTVVTVEGLRLCFLTCYDFYYYEAYSNIARQKPDLIIGCSHQRSDSHAYSETTARFLAYQTNAYVLRASVSLDENSDIGGGSLVAAPDGSLVLAMKSRVGLGICEIDPAKKFVKAAGFGNPPSSHFDYVEKGRRPWKYRPAGSAVCLPDAPYALNHDRALRRRREYDRPPRHAGTTLVGRRGPSLYLPRLRPMLPGRSGRHLHAARRRTKGRRLPRPECIRPALPLRDAPLALSQPARAGRRRMCHARRRRPLPHLQCPTVDVPHLAVLARAAGVAGKLGSRGAPLPGHERRKNMDGSGNRRRTGKT